MANKRKFKIKIAGPDDPVYKEGFKPNPINSKKVSKKKTWDDLIKKAEERFGKNSSLSQFWRETKEKSLINKQRRFEEIYYDRPVAFSKDDK